MSIHNHYSFDHIGTQMYTVVVKVKVVFLLTQLIRLPALSTINVATQNVLLSHLKKQKSDRHVFPKQQEEMKMLHF